MKNLIRLIALAILSIILAAPLGAAEERKTRSGQKQYNYTTGSVGQGGTNGEVTLGSVTFSTRPSESWATIRIEDMSELPVRAMASQDTDGDGTPEWKNEFCARTSRAIPITGGTNLQVFLLDGPCKDGSLALATSGIVRTTFTR